jgi:hypothetical protein
MVRRWVIAAWVGAVSCSSVAGTFSVTLKVIDTDKRPVPNASAALFWNVKDGAMTPSSDSGASDERGRAVLKVDDWNRPRALMVLSTDRKLGGVIGVSKEDGGKEVAVTLAPTVRVKGKLECKELNFKPSWANTMVIPEGFTAQVAQQMGESAEFDFVLPVGKYTLRSYGTDVVDRKEPITLLADRGEYDLGTLDLKASAIAKLKGKPAPGWKVTDVRGVKKTSKLSDYKGKWLYLEFWGFW